MNQQGRSASFSFTLYNVVFNYTASYSQIQQPVSVGYKVFTLPSAISVSYRLNGSGTIPSTFSMSVSFLVVGNLYATPYCLQTEFPVPTQRDYSWSATVNVNSPSPGTTYNATSTFPNGYFIKCEDAAVHGAGVHFSIGYVNSSGNYKTVQDQVTLNIN